jgi:hypothetical protein
MYVCTVGRRVHPALSNSMHACSMSDEVLDGSIGAAHACIRWLEQQEASVNGTRA